MRLNRKRKGIIGLIICVLILAGGIAVTTAVRTSSEKNRTTLENILRPDSAYVGTISRNTPHFDGGAASVVEASFNNKDMPQVEADLRQRLALAGFSLTCPGGKDTTAPDGQEVTLEPRQKCGVSGHGADGTVWLGTTADGAQLSAIVSF